jgi:hypothetical protein
MMANRRKRNILSSWKEIANYLNCSVRTCTRWEEKYGLPVHRIDKESRTTVHAYTDELDEWLRERKREKTPVYPQAEWLKKPFLYVALIIFAAALIYFFFFRKSPDIRPADFRIKGSKMIILNENGDELWRYNTGIENLMPEKHYRDHFQFKRIKNIWGNKNLPHLIIKDINNDSMPEVLFSIQTQDQFGEGELFCFSNEGSLLWKREVGRELKFGPKIYSSDYRIRGIDIHDFNKDNDREITIIADQRYFFPTQFLILDNQGDKLGEHWNSGRLGDYVFIDLNEDENDEIVVVGTNNEYTKGSLIVFDPSLVRGCSPQSGYFRCEELEPGTEKYYLLFPRTDVDQHDHIIESMISIEVLSNNRMSLQAGASAIYFELNCNLEIEDVRLSHKFELMHKEALMEMKINSPLNSDYRENLAKGILYYDGSDWVSKPTMTAYWKNKPSDPYW